MATSGRRQPPALTVAEREGQLISLATDLAEKQLRDGTASSQMITHYLKMSSVREELERERLRQENAKLRAITESIESGKKSQELYESALIAFRSYHEGNIANGPDETY